MPVEAKKEDTKAVRGSWGVLVSATGSGTAGSWKLLIEMSPSEGSGTSTPVTSVPALTGNAQLCDSSVSFGHRRVPDEVNFVWPLEAPDP